MAGYTRKVADVPSARAEGNRLAINEVITALGVNGSLVHYRHDTADLVTTADASDLATSKALAWALALAVKAHAIKTGIHSVADDSSAATMNASWTANPLVPVNLTEVQNIANELATDINAHIANATPHRSKWGTIGVDGVLTVKAITTTAAIDQSTSNALLNAIKNFYNAHLKDAASLIELVAS